MTRTISKYRLQRELIRKFEFEPVSGSRHDAVALIVGGRKIATTRFSRGHRSEDLGPSMLSKIAQQIRLQPGSLPKLHGMVDCTVSREDYLKELRDAGYL